MCNCCNFGQWPSFMPKYDNFENRPVSRKPLPVERKETQFRPPEVERQYKYNCWNFSDTILNGYSLFPKIWAVTQKRLTVEQNRWKFGPRLCMQQQGWHFWPWTCLGHLVSFSALFRKLGRNSKMTHRRAKRTEIWTLVGVCSMYVFFSVFFLPWTYQCHLGSFSAFFAKRA